MKLKVSDGSINFGAMKKKKIGNRVDQQFIVNLEKLISDASLDDPQTQNVWEQLET